MRSRKVCRVPVTLALAFALALGAGAVHAHGDPSGGGTNLRVGEHASLSESGPDCPTCLLRVAHAAARSDEDRWHPVRSDRRPSAPAEWEGSYRFEPSAPRAPPALS